jgi:hypothetical protein
MEKNCVRKEHRRPAKQTPLAILLRLDFSEELGGTTKTKYGG